VKTKTDGHIMSLSCPRW